MKKLPIVVLLLLLSASAAMAQLNFHFLPELYGRSIDGLGNFQVQHTGIEKLPGRIFITVRENRTSLQVVTIATPSTVFSPGMMNFPKSLFNTSAFSFASNDYGAIANQTRNIPPGDYTFCFKFVPNEKNTYDEYENCFEANIEPLVPLTLIYPGHLDTLCLKRPLLTWQPPMPFHTGMRFRLLLTEKLQGEAVENMLMNRPLLLLDNITATSINYPSTQPELKEGKTYCWQVVAYEKGLIVSRSEIWEFTIRCKEESKPSPNESYRELKIIANGNHYIANGYLKFSFQNNYNIKKLQYAILDIENGATHVKSIPEVNLQLGLNKIDIDISDLGLKPGNHYFLKVYPFNEPPIQIRFIYTEDNNIEIK